MGDGIVPASYLSVKRNGLGAVGAEVIEESYVSKDAFSDPFEYHIDGIGQDGVISGVAFDNPGSLVINGGAIANTGGDGLRFGSGNFGSGIVPPWQKGKPKCIPFFGAAFSSSGGELSPIQSRPLFVAHNEPVQGLTSRPTAFRSPDAYTCPAPPCGG